MTKKVLSAVLSLTMAASAFGGFASTANAAEAKTPKYQTNARQMERLNRGLIAVYRTADAKSVDKAGVYLSWRLLGDEPLETQEYDIYKNGSKIYTTTGVRGTNYIDVSGKTTDKYKVVKAGASEAEVAAEDEVSVGINHVAKSGNGTSDLPNSFTYVDVPLERPADSNGGHYYTVDKTEGGANDASVGDLDGDGDYEIVLKWDPTNSKDAAGGGETGRTYIDAYEIGGAPEGSEHKYMWRIDLGPHVRSGAHENPFLVYDFDGDGRAEIVSITGLGATDGNGKYVTDVGDTEEIRSADNTKTYLRKGKNIGPEYYTIFDGETGAALCTTDAIPIGPNKNEDGSFGPEDGSYYGDSSMNRSSRYLAAVAYLDGVHPSAVMCRGYYNRAMLRAYTWDGTELTMQWEHNGDKSGTTLYGQGNHNLSVGDIDNDGKDEIVYGSASLDDDGKTVLGNTLLGHGDAIHMSDFNNDGIQEVFSVKEKGEGYKTFAEDLRVASTGEHFWASGKITTTGDNGRGVMANIDDAYAKSEYDKGNKNVMALGWSSGKLYVHDFNGDDVNPTGKVPTYNETTKKWANEAKPAAAGNGSFDNSLVYWDGDLGRELLDANIIQKFDAANSNTTRFWGESDGYTLTGGSTNNYTKRNASLSADLWGDWREEIIMPVGKGQNDTPVLRIFTSTLPTDYRLTTLMHDCQYRLAVAWQNVGYNQPPHTSYYIGSAALATDANGKTLNYLAPEVPYTKVTYDLPAKVDVTGVDIKEDEIKVEKGKTVSLTASVSPENATKKGIAWTTSNNSVAVVSNGVVRGVAPGTAIITATTKESGFTDTCIVTVFENPVKAVLISEKVINLGIGNTMKLTAKPDPSDASDTEVTWTSDDTSVAVVSSDGTVTGKGYGKTLVKAEIGGVTAQCIVKVKPMNIADATGENVFESSNADGETIKLENASATSGTLKHKAASAGGEFHKDFQVYDSNTATLTFHFTTGGQQDASGAWKWAGREYTLNMALLDSEGNNIITVAQPYAKDGAGSMTSKVRDEEAAIFDSDWSGDRGDIQGSTKRWIVTFEFDYDNDICNARIIGTDGSWATINGNKTKTFSLNGASFKTLKFYTEPNNGGLITAAPKLEALTYTSTEQISGETEVLYENGTKNEPWAATDLTDWTQTGTETAALEYDEENGRIGYNPTKPGAEYSAEKTFDVTAGAVVSYDIDWYFGSSVGRDGNYEYLQIGDKLSLGWTNGYKVLLSTDGGKTYDENAVFTGENNIIYTKNVSAQFNTESKTVTLLFDGKQIYSGGYSDLDGNTADGANKVKFGFTRVGATPDWAVPNGIERIRVAQFNEGEEEPDFSSMAITDITGTDVDIDYVLAFYNNESIRIFGVLYDEDDNFVEAALSEDIEFEDSMKNLKTGSVKLTFMKNVEDYKLKVFAWDSLDGMEPVLAAVKYPVESTTEQ